ncbi:helix-turn-helix domain-containing protein [Haladaptatus sp. DJG-WS-42]|uniref:helix-turn-helix domain-containing protein n=1 Tax=Haladaptatus sp. DJG-WS-42 TaxID=3120516 RepID=UPI0030CCEF8A
MLSGIRATVEFASTETCPIATLSNEVDHPIYSRSTSISPLDSTHSVTEFLLEGEVPDLDPDIEPIFAYGPTRLYRYTHDRGVTCPCECLGLFGCPIERYFAHDGTFTIVFHATDFHHLQEVIADLRDRFPDIDIKRLVRSPTEGTAKDNVFVDRSRLTERQFEVLQTAYEMGYFSQPRGANATEIASTLGISQSTFAQHLAAAQSKVFDQLLERDG